MWNKLKALIWPVLCLLMVFSISFSAYKIYYNTNYSFIYVDGDSMYPTLSGKQEKSDYGTMDLSTYTLDRIERFDILITYYNEDYIGGYVPGSTTNKLKEGATYKIKRVYALPNETFSIEGTNFYIYNGAEKILVEKDFQINSHDRTYGKRTLNSDEYFVLGDNWVSSHDSFHSSVGPIHRGMLVGTLISIDGYGKIDSESKKLKDMVPQTPVIYKRHGK